MCPMCSRLLIIIASTPALQQARGIVTHDYSAGLLIVRTQPGQEEETQQRGCDCENWMMTANAISAPLRLKENEACVSI